MRHTYTKPQIEAYNDGYAMAMREINDTEKLFLLYRLLDDIDTLDDAVKGNDKAFREHTRSIVRKRFEVLAETAIDALYDVYYKE